MKNRKSLFMFPSIFIFLLLCLYPIFKLLIDIKEVKSPYLSLGIIITLLIFILLSIIVFVEEIYLISYLWTKMKINVVTKMIWTFILLSLNVVVIPYFYMRFVTGEKKIILKSMLYLIPIVVFLGIFMFGYNTYTDKMNKLIIKRKKIEETKNIYKTKDNITSFTFGYGYKQENVGEYDLYVKNKSKNIIFTAYTYETFQYEQKTSDDFLNKGIKDISAGKEVFELYNDKQIIEEDDKVISTIEYRGKTKESSMCIYKISTITFKNRNEYLVYIVEVITDYNYDLYKKELTNILKTAKN